MLPEVIVHADWGTDPTKRVASMARLLPGGRFWIEAPRPLGRTGSWRARLNIPAAVSGPILVGFNFPIGVPATYARRAGIHSFPKALTQFAQGEWTLAAAVDRVPANAEMRGVGRGTRDTTAGHRSAGGDSRCGDEVSRHGSR